MIGLNNNYKLTLSKLLSEYRNHRVVLDLDNVVHIGLYLIIDVVVRGLELLQVVGLDHPVEFDELGSWVAGLEKLRLLLLCDLSDHVRLESGLHDGVAHVDAQNQGYLEGPEDLEGADLRFSRKLIQLGFGQRRSENVEFLGYRDLWLVKMVEETEVLEVEDV